MSWKLGIVALILVSVTGCTTIYPLPIHEPQVVQTGSGKGGVKTVKNPEPDYQRGGLLPPQNAEEAVKNMKIYADAYESYAGNLRVGNYVASDVALAGGIVGVVGGLTKSLDTSIAGAVIAAGSSAFADRYQLVLQATNYEKAGEAMYCMYNHVYPDGKGVDVSFAREKIDEVRRKLKKYQVSVQLASPDLSQLEESIKTKLETRSATEAKMNLLRQQYTAAGIDPMAKDLGTKITALSATTQATIGALVQEVTAAQQEELNAKLDTCVSAF